MADVIGQRPFISMTMRGVNGQLVGPVVAAFTLEELFRLPPAERAQAIKQATMDVVRQALEQAQDANIWGMHSIIVPEHSRT